MKKGLLIFIIGLLTGVATSLFIHSNNQQANQVMIPSHLEKSETLTNEETGDIVRLNKQLNKKEARISRLNAENANLRAELRNLMEIRKAKSPRVAPHDLNGEQEAPFLDQMSQRQFQRQLDSRVNSLADRLDLDINQEKTIRSLLEQQAEWRREQMQARMEGEESEKDKTEKPSFNLDDELEDVLSDEQLEQYNELQEEEYDTNSKIAASIELERISTKLGLTDEQRDEFYKVLYSEAHELISSSEGGAPSFQEDWQNERLKKMPFLTDDQLNEYNNLIADEDSPLPPAPPR